MSNHPASKPEKSGVPLWLYNAFKEGKSHSEICTMMCEEIRRHADQMGEDYEPLSPEHAQELAKLLVQLYAERMD